MAMAREILDKVVRSVKEGATSVARESERLARMARVRLEIGSLQARLNDHYEEIGRVLHARFRSGALGDPDLAALCAQAEDIDRQIQRLEQALGELRASETRPEPPQAQDTTSESRQD
jgi:hypothetical protein